MTPNEYIAAGYQLSGHMEQAFISQAEADVTNCYISPIVGGAILSQSSEAIVKAATMRLAFMLMSERATKETRSGAKLKLAANSQSVGISSVIDEMAASAHMAIQNVRAIPEAMNPATEVTDICRIYYGSNFFNI